jgi:MFS family permease
MTQRNAARRRSSPAHRPAECAALDVWGVPGEASQRGVAPVLPGVPEHRDSAVTCVMTAAREPRPALPRTVWMLGLVSLFMDMSSELVHAVLPVYLTAVLGVGAFSVGVIEGVAEATASMLKVVSGALSDRFRRRKPLALAGYGLAALTKPWFPLAETAVGVVAARFVDRIGKGLRGAPRDALVADVTPPDQRDAAYGLRQSLDTVGAFLGPLIAMGLLTLYPGELRGVLWFAVVPAVIAVVLLWRGVDEPPLPAEAARGAGHATRSAAVAAAGASSARARRFGRAHLARLPGRLWAVVALTVLLTGARLPEAFLVLGAHTRGTALVFVPAVLIVMSAAYAVSAWPAGLASARFGRRGMLVVGLVLLAASQTLLARGTGEMVGFWGAVALWGLHMGFTQGVLSAAVAAEAPADLRGTAFGVFHLATGLAQLAAGAAIGALWAWVGESTAWAAGAALAVVCVPFAWGLVRPAVAAGRP